MKSLKSLADQLEEALPRALQGDPVSVKRARTTGRRLRVALALEGEHGLERERSKTLVRATRRLARALGAVRDRDALLELLSAQHDDERLGVRLAQQALERERRQCLRRLRQSRLVQRWRRAARPLSTSDSALPPEPQPQPEVLHQAAQRALALDEAVRNPARVTELHALRIIVKRLRYTLIRTPAPDPALKAQVTALQSVLGTIHDLDVLLDWLRALKRPNKRQRQSLKALRVRLAEERLSAYRSFLEQWEAALPTLGGL